MHDVARLADVSLKTVSRVVNDESGVSETLVTRVNNAVETLGYQPDLRARNLRGKQGAPTTIGFIQTNSANPFFSAIRESLETAAAEHGCLILSGTSQADAMIEAKLIDAMLGRRVDGLVVVPSLEGSKPLQALLQREITRGTPMVLVDREGDTEVDAVVSDNRGGGRQATEHLLAAGHRRIVFLGRGSSLQSTIERQTGFGEAMESAGVDQTEIKRLTRLDVESADAEYLVRRFLDQPADVRPTAIFSSQNQLTKGAIKALHRAGKHHDVALVGFDDIEMADVIEPGITVVAQDPAELGRSAARLLFERLIDDRRQATRHVVDVALIPRGSGEISAP